MRLTQVVGTPAYIAPEQAFGQRLDARADVHALGAVAYVLLTGRLVREDGIASLLDPQLPPAPSTVADVPRRLDAPVLKALAVDPAQRWPDVASFIAALEARLPEPARGRLWSTAVLAVLVLVVTFVASYVVVGLVR